MDPRVPEQGGQGEEILQAPTIEGGSYHRVSRLFTWSQTTTKWAPEVVPTKFHRHHKLGWSL